MLPGRDPPWLVGSLITYIMTDVESAAGSGGNLPNPQDWSIFKRLKESSHPLATVFYICLRVAPLFVYFFGSLITKNSVLVFIVVSLLLAADFWNVKNISGRLLVGLRWWNETSSDGQSTWVFETADPQRYINPIDSRCFWLFLYGVPAAWCVFGFLALLKLQFIWLLEVALALVLVLTNTFAFSRCDKFSRANTLIGQVSNGVASRLLNALGTRLFSRS